MFDELIGTIKAGFMWTIVILVVAGVIMCVHKHLEANKREQQEQERLRKRRDTVDRIKEASKRWSRDYKLLFLEEVTKVYNMYAKGCDGGYPLFIHPDIDGKEQSLYLNMQELHEVYCYITATLNR